MNNNMDERRDEGELTAEELQEKADQYREAKADDEMVRELEERDALAQMKAEAGRDVAHAIGVHKLIMSAFK